MQPHEQYGLNLYKNWAREAFLHNFVKEVGGKGSKERNLSQAEEENARRTLRKRMVSLPGSKDDFLKGLIVKNAFGFDDLTLTRIAGGEFFKDRKKHDAEVRALLGFDIFKDWHNQFTFDERSLDHVPSRGIDPRLGELAQRIDLRGLRVLELGCLEGHHSIDLQSLGSGEVVSIEGRNENFLKSLVVKNAFELDRCTFLLGDIQDILAGFSATFDVCVALGILYHFKEPLPVIHRIAELSNALFVWMHYSNHESPNGAFVEVEYRGKKYRGKHVLEDIRYRLDGLDGQAFRICEEDIPRVFHDAGFSDVEILSKENAENGPAVTLLAKKS